MSIATNQGILVELYVAYSFHVDTNARKSAMLLDNAMQMKKNCLRMDVERDATSLERLAVIDVKYLVIRDKNAQRFHVMLKSECIANVVTGTLMLFANQ